MITLSSKIKSFNSWLLLVSEIFWRSCRGVSFTVIISSIVSKVSSIVAFLLPLKVVLLASSDGVPKYFQFFVSEEDKFDWLVGMALAAFFFYALSVFLDLLSERSAESGSDRVEESRVGIPGKRSDQIKPYFKLVGLVWAELLFGLICFTSLFLIDQYLFWGVFCLIGIEYGFSSCHARRFFERESSIVGRYLIEETSGYLKILSSINFLLGFVIILLPYLMGVQANILWSIVCIIVLRQGLASVVSLITNCLKLSKGRGLIDGFILDKVKVREVELPKSREQRELIQKIEREAWIREHLAKFIPVEKSISVKWMDPLFRNYNLFEVTSESEFSGGIKSIQLQVLGASWQHLAEKEGRLFDHVDYLDICAARRLAVFEERGFTCQALDLEGAIPVPREHWVSIEIALLKKFWSCGFENGLLDYCAVSKEPFWKRFSSDVISRLKLAAVGAGQVSAVEELLENLPAVSKFLRSVPLYVFNPDIQPTNVFSSALNSRYIIPNWGRWSLEPVGFKLPLGIKDEDIEECLSAAKSARDNFDDDLSVADIRLVNSLAQLEFLITWQKYNAAFDYVYAINEANFFIGDGEALEES